MLVAAPLLIVFIVLAWRAFAAQWGQPAAAAATLEATASATTPG
jgi:hypothetical protein